MTMSGGARKSGEVTELTFELTNEEVEELNAALPSKVPKKFQFSITSKYDNHRTISLTVDHKPVLADLAKASDLSTEFRKVLKSGF